MNLNELYSLYDYLKRMIDDVECTIGKDGEFIEDYLVDENMVLDLYHKIIRGEAYRKDFLISSIKDMIHYIERNQIKGIYSTLLIKFKRLYLK